MQKKRLLKKFAAYILLHEKYHIIVIIIFCGKICFLDFLHTTFSFLDKIQFEIATEKYIFLWKMLFNCLLKAALNMK
jgi:hypothetical protein